MGGFFVFLFISFYLIKGTEILRVSDQPFVKNQKEVVNFRRTEERGHTDIGSTDLFH